MAKIGPSHIGQRAAQKAASRSADQQLIDRGVRSPREINQANNFFASLDISSFALAKLGDRRLKSGN